MIKEKNNNLTEAEIEELAANLVGFTIEESRNLDKILNNGIPKLIEATRKEIISITKAAEIAELPQKKQLHELSLILENNRVESKN